MEVVPDCAACHKIADAYESETLTWFRLEGQLRIAEYGHDATAVEGIALELDATTRRRAELRGAMATHTAEFHRNNASSQLSAMSAG